MKHCTEQETHTTDAREKGLNELWDSNSLQKIGAYALGSSSREKKHSRGNGWRLLKIRRIDRLTGLHIVILDRLDVLKRRTEEDWCELLDSDPMAWDRLYSQICTLMRKGEKKKVLWYEGVKMSEQRYIG